MWIEFITHEKFRWKWKPWFLKSHMVYTLGDVAWIAPLWECGWLCFVFHWKAYNLKKIYKRAYAEHECPADIMQERINELESAILSHKRLKQVEGQSVSDRKLWSSIIDNSED